MEVFYTGVSVRSSLCAVRMQEDRKVLEGKLTAGGRGTEQEIKIVEHAPEDSS